jgi:catechol 2,3-dioxygenase-like lactoylglutathione lyase family enzyme
MRLQHVGITFPPGQADVIRGFYGGVVGIPEMPVPAEVADEGWVWFATSDEGIELHFIPRPLAPDPERVHHFCLQVDDLDALRARVTAFGSATFEAGAEIHGRRRFFTRDPVGNLVEFIEFAPDAG